MTLKDTGIYKNRIIALLSESEEIAELLLGVGYDAETADEELIYNHIYPYLYVDGNGDAGSSGTQTAVKSYVCVEVDVAKTANFTYKDMKIIIWCYCHRDGMRYTKPGFLGTKADILSDMTDRLLNGSRRFGVGRLKLESSSHITPGDKFYGRELIYSCSEF